MGLSGLITSVSGRLKRTRSQGASIKKAMRCSRTHNLQLPCASAHLRAGCQNPAVNRISAAPLTPKDVTVQPPGDASPFGCYTRFPGGPFPTTRCFWRSGDVPTTSEHQGLPRIGTSSITSVKLFHSAIFSRPDVPSDRWPHRPPRSDCERGCDRRRAAPKLARRTESSYLAFRETTGSHCPQPRKWPGNRPCSSHVVSADFGLQTAVCVRGRGHTTPGGDRRPSCAALTA